MTDNSVNIYKAARMASGLTQERAAELLGCSTRTIAAYEQGEDPLTVVEAARYSRLHPRCGTTFLLFVLAISIFLHALSVPALLAVWQPQHAVIKHTVVICFKLLLMAPISAMAYEAIRMAARIKSPGIGAELRGPGLVLQTLTTREPDPSQLEVGLVALSEALGDDAAASIKTPAFTRLEQC